MGRNICRALRKINGNHVVISVMLLWNILFLLWYVGRLSENQGIKLGPRIADDKDEILNKRLPEATMPMIPDNDAPLSKDGLSKRRQDPVATPVPLRKRWRKTAPPPAIISAQKVLGLPPTQLHPNDVTVVTAFLNIGKYYKEDEDMTYHPSNFENWMKIFKRIQNPVIAYFDNDNYIKTFKTLRNKFPEKMTKVIRVDRNKLWAFMLRSKIQNVFRQRLYPQHKPETTNIQYNCNTHSKYDFIDMAIHSNPFGSPYYAWLDMGTFRNIVAYRDKEFKIIVPARFNQKDIGFTQIGEFQNRSIRAQDVVKQNLKLVDSQFFIGKADVLKAWVRRYREVVESMIKKGWISGDEQVIYYMAQSGVGMSTKLYTYRYKGDDPGTMKHAYLAYHASTLDSCEYDLSCK